MVTTKKKTCRRFLKDIEKRMKLYHSKKKKSLNHKGREEEGNNINTKQRK